MSVIPERFRTWRERPGRAAAICALLLVAGGAFSAMAELMAEPPRAPSPAAAAPHSFEAQDHFPGAALHYVDLPRSGATGTIALPDVPVPSTLADDATIRAAAPFALRGTPLDHARALQCLTAAIYYEAANEPDDGQAAVAQVILNRVRHPAFPASVCGVVYQGSELPVCQFSFACDGAMARVPMRSAWDRARRAAARALSGAVFAPAGLATHYHTYAVTPAWNRTLVMTGAFGAHFFHRWKGWWGTAAAFRQVYSGVEPTPGPHARAAEPTVTAPAEITATAAALLKTGPAAPAPVTDIQPEHRDSGTPQARYAATSLPESTILDRWKDSGKPLR